MASGLNICPLLLPQNLQESVYDGYISVGSQDYRVRISMPHAQNLARATVECDWNLQQLLTGYEPVIQQRLLHAADLPSFLTELKSIVERLKDKEVDSQTAPPKLCSQLIQEIETLGWEKLVSVDSTFQNLSLQIQDVAGRNHVVKVCLSPKHPTEAPQCTSDLPIMFNFHWDPKGSLQNLLKQYQDVLEACQEFWNMVSEIDQKTWVLEPEKPRYSATHRRIAIGTNASLQIVVDPRHPRMLPECRFLGADQIVNPLRDKLNTNVHTWDLNLTLLENLQNLLGISFPSPMNSKKEDFSVECGICYSYRLESEIPDNVCDDPHCSQPFHQTCLYEWLRALPSSRQSFNMIFGECPLCSKPITVKILIMS